MWSGAAGLLLISCLILFHKLGAASLLGDESTFAQVAREAAEQGHWRPMTIHGAPFVNKPPLKLWATAAIFRAFGVSEWNDRVLDALFGVGTILLVYFFGSAFFGIRTGLTAGLFLLSAHYFIFRHGPRSGVTDSILVFLMSCALLSYLRSRKEDPATERLRPAILCGVLTGVSLLTKNAVGWLVPAAIGAFEAIRAVLRRRAGSLFGRPLARLAAIGLVALAFQAAWILAVNRTTGGRAGALFHEDVWERFRVGLEPGHRNPGLYRFVLWFDFGKGLLLLPAAFFFAWKDLRAGEHERSERVVFLTVWAAVVLSVMEISVSKLSWYIDPAYPAIALLLGFGFDRLASELGKRSRLLSAGFVSIVALFIGLHLWRSWGAADRDDVQTDAARLATWFSRPGAASLCREPGLRMREWEEFYLWPIARESGSGAAGCEMILTRNPSRYLSEEENSTRAHRFQNYAPNDPPLFVVRPAADLPLELFPKAPPRDRPERRQAPSRTV